MEFISQAQKLIHHVMPMNMKHHILTMLAILLAVSYLGCTSSHDPNHTPSAIQSWVILSDDTADGERTPSFYGTKAAVHFKAEYPDLHSKPHQLKSVAVRKSPAPAGVIKVVFEGDRVWSSPRWRNPQVWVFMNADGTLRRIEQTTVGYMKPTILKKKE